ncbi:hypothetical protein GCM10023149_34460 [Mucilaginibacter gynuensis]|uniref:M23ase beta-sheet core domain-containing protein n=1 Tax=Mucilaginibacter gynuensis TaxID=1302236 RepID=A0ABP8GU04_9SPHI
MDATHALATHLDNYPHAIGKVVDFDAGNDKLFPLDLTADNTELNAGLIADTQKFDEWLTAKLKATGSRYAVGGYMEHRTIYAGRSLFDESDDPRRLHLGVDIWAAADTPVYTPLPGIVHSFQDNDNFGDYGPTIILQYDIAGLTLYSLYGHLSRTSLLHLAVGQVIDKGTQIATFGAIPENGHWSPHLHFQLMLDMQGKQGDYPGVAKFSEKESWLSIIPDPNLILQFPATIKS